MSELITRAVHTSKSEVISPKCDASPQNAATDRKLTQLNQVWCLDYAKRIKQALLLTSVPEISFRLLRKRRLPLLSMSPQLLPSFGV